ncbi:TetR/AcrR family transcriptional regulator [Crossiella cryophila]|uniref:AcrR family transcriptional regulator n=1 Tax=Crossiella cryophila TaxID=43355 RepID=A0A7W7CHX6_9PSEU|nr:TetR/AcrR family transcriptional regulator [Crossiella cryophila]MBB4681506.1 AcrR family transcriptional regulator [Crossiella cryophila]
MTEQKTGPAALRPRSQRARAAVLKAATELMREPGPELTVDAIAARSGVSKATIYKHWPNKTAVAIDAFAEHMATQVPLPDTGSAHADLRELVHSVFAFYSSADGQTFAGLIAGVHGDETGKRMFVERFLLGRREGVRTVWARGVDRGELRADVDVEVAIDLLFGPAIFRLMTGHDTFGPDFADAVTEAALRGLATGV